jgi:DNA-directed RNA polymerase specialized sigma24 family protein
MKENLNMNYRDIAKELGRNERTIWTAYKKANEKQKEPIKISETEIDLPISIFENNELTILESIIIYLKNNGKKYSEIGKLLYRDQRNIWTIYSRAINKIKKEKEEGKKY